MNERTSSRDDSAPADRPAGVEARAAEADHQAAEAVARHHREMVTVLAERVEAIVGAVDRDDSAAAERARAALTRWCDDELLPHAAAEERALYPMAREDPAGRLLVEGMLDEHQRIIGWVDRLRTAGGIVRALGAATGLLALLEAHLAKENELLLPLLVANPKTSVAAALNGLREVLGSG